MVGPDGRIAVVSQHGNSWSLPKGHIELSEDDETAARREITEETGLTELHLVRPLGEYVRARIGPGGVGEALSEMKLLKFFLFTTTQTELKPIDPANPEARWVDKNDVADMLTHAKDKEFFRSVQATL